MQKNSKIITKTFLNYYQELNFKLLDKIEFECEQDNVMLLLDKVLMVNHSPIFPYILYHQLKKHKFFYTYLDEPLLLYYPFEIVDNILFFYYHY
jgi:hypothetical protein